MEQTTVSVFYLREIPVGGKPPLDTWKSIEEVSHNTFDDQNRWVYRGQHDSRWSLTTTLERALQATQIDMSKAWGIEGGLLRRFQRQACHHLSPVPDAKDIPGWLSWMQHFGAPTRLLDWTHSFYVGLYFAVRDLIQDHGTEAALWAIDWKWLETTTYGDSLDTFRQDRNLQGFENFRELLGPNTKPGILKINAFRLNMRLAIQQGTFLIPRAISRSFMGNLDFALTTSKDHSFCPVIKMRISGRARNETLRHLIRMNINEATLFPDLQG
jgi:hypothetical protein